MAETIRAGTRIRDFQPDNTDKELYIDVGFMGGRGAITVSSLLNKIREKWPDANLDEVTITAEHIHTRCLTYDLYSHSDYDDFLLIERP